jgi:hypothetical protein
MYLAPEWPWPPWSGGRLQAKFITETLGEWFDVVVLAPDRPDELYPIWTAAVARVAARRGSSSMRAVDTLRGLIAGRQVFLERLRQSKAPNAFRLALEHIRPAVCVLARPMFAEFIDAARSVGSQVVIDANEDLVQVGRSIVGSRASAGPRAVALVDTMIVGRQQRREYVRADAVIVASEVERARLSSQCRRTASGSSRMWSPYRRSHLHPDLFGRSPS